MARAKMKRACFYADDEALRKLGGFVDAGVFLNESEAMRTAINDFLTKWLPYILEDADKEKRYV